MARFTGSPWVYSDTADFRSFQNGLFRNCHNLVKFFFKDVMLVIALYNVGQIRDESLNILGDYWDGG